MIDWDDAFDNSAYVAGSDQLPARWQAEARQFRTQMLNAKRLSPDQPYGNQPRQHLDLFYPQPSQAQPVGLVVFIHGGYWQRLDKSYWSHLAQGVLAAGWAMAIPSYTLAPQARISAITQEVATAITDAAQQVAGPIRLVGHSAGGHLVARMVCADSPLTAAIQTRIAHVVSISGIHDLRPLQLTAMNDVLQLTEQEAKDESPALHPPLTGIPLHFWVGAAERPELLRQTRLIAEQWQPQAAADNPINDHYEPGKNHFSVIESLAIADSPLVATLLN